jgi:hypothetical protein
MKRWGWLVAGLYMLALVALSLPALMAAFWPDMHVRELGKVFVAWPYWAWIVLMGVSALLLLAVPVRVAERRWKGRRPLAVPIVTAGLLLALLTLCALLSIDVGLWGDHAPPLFRGVDAPVALACVGLAAVSFWLGWGALFYRVTRRDAPEALVRRAASWLLRGSILEFLMALSAHIVVRRRDDCCAPIGSFIGIAAGLSVMLLAFGPGVFFLFAARCARLKPGGAASSPAP